MKTVIIIPTVPGNEQVLAKCLESIKKYVKEEHEVIVELNDFEGFAVATNRGIRKALKNPEVDGVITGNDDCVVTEKGCITNMRKVTQKNMGIAVPPSLYRPTHVTMGWCYFPRQVLEDVGLFDERFELLEWEDIDLSVRLQEKGYALNILNNEYMIQGKGEARHRFTPAQIKIMKNNKNIFKKKWKGTKWEYVFR